MNSKIDAILDSARKVQTKIDAASAASSAARAAANQEEERRRNVWDDKIVKELAQELGKINAALESNSLPTFTKEPKSPNPYPRGAELDKVVFQYPRAGWGGHIRIELVRKGSEVALAAYRNQQEYDSKKPIQTRSLILDEISAGDLAAELAGIAIELSDPDNK